MPYFVVEKLKEKICGVYNFDFLVRIDQTCYLVSVGTEAYLQKNESAEFLGAPKNDQL